MVKSISRALCFLLSLGPTTLYACIFSVDSVEALNFGSYVLADNGEANGWLRVDIDGSLSISSRGYVLSDTAKDVRRGYLSLNVEDAKLGSVLEVKVSSLDSRLSIFPTAWVEYRTFSNLNSAKVDIYFGGQLDIVKSFKGSISTDVKIEARCVEL